MHAAMPPSAGTDPHGQVLTQIGPCTEAPSDPAGAPPCHRGDRLAPDAWSPALAEGGLAARALGWVVRLGVVPEDIVPALVGAPSWQVERALRAPRAAGLIAAVTVDRPAWRAARRLVYASAGTGAADPLAGQAPTAVRSRTAPPAGRAVLARLVRAEATVAVADLIAALAAGAPRRHRRPGDAIVLEDAWTVGQGSGAAAPGRPPVPPATEAIVRLRSGDGRLGCALAWEAPGTPASQRRARVAAWYRADEQAARLGAGPPLPPVLVLCPDERAALDWAAAVEAGAARRGRPLLAVVIATAVDLAAVGPLGGCWRTPGRPSSRAPLIDRLPWRGGAAARWSAPPSPSATLGSVGYAGGRPAATRALALPVAGQGSSTSEQREAARHARGTDGQRLLEHAECTAHGDAVAAGVPPATNAGAGRAPSLGAWAAGVIHSPAAFARLPPLQQQAALAVGLSATQQTLLGWIGRQPLLTTAQLALHTGLTAKAVTALLVVPWSLRLVEPDHGFAGRVGAAAEPCYVLTIRGAALLAALVGVPLRRALVDGVLAATGDTATVDDTPAANDQPAAAGVRRVGDAAAVRLADLRRRPEHTAGVQWFARSLAREAATARAGGADHQLMAWANPTEAQATVRWRGRAWTIRPDARFAYRIGGVTHIVLLEWDRGLVRRRDYARKFAAYAAHAAVREDWGASTMLVIATPVAAVARVQAELNRAGRRVPALTELSVVISYGVVRGERIMATLQAAKAGD